MGKSTDDNKKKPVPDNNRHRYNKFSDNGRYRGTNSEKYTYVFGYKIKARAAFAIHRISASRPV